MDIDTILKHYLICALWADMPEEDDSGSIEDIDSQSVELAKADIMQFISLAGALLDKYPNGSPVATKEEQLGHDIWLTRNGHGAGFFDRDNLPGTLGNDLTKVCNKLSSRCIYRGDDGKIYID